MQRVVLGMLLLALVGVACNGPRRAETTDSPTPPAEDAPMTLHGTITYIDLEGGFYGILGDDGRRYLPLNLGPAFEQDGLRIRFEATPEDVLTLQQWGKPVKIISMVAI